MGSDLFNNLFKAFIYFFLNPLLIVAIFAALLVGYYRVKRERKSFRVRILPGITELQNLLKSSFIYGVLLSILIVGIGLIVDIGWLVLLCSFSIVLLLTMNFKLMSPVYLSFLSFISLYALQYFRPTFEYLSWQVSDLDFFGPLVVTIPIISGLLLFMEGLLIYQVGGKGASTYLLKTNRGLNAGIFKAKKIWLLPILFVVPGEMIGAFLPYWPQFSLGHESFAFLPIPFIIAFSQQFRATFPEKGAMQIGRALMFTAFIVIVVGFGALWMPILGWTALIVGVVVRMSLSIITSVRERKAALVLNQQTDGLVIAGILPNSPSEKMGLIPGEIIRSVNGQKVRNEKELYDAIQLNAAHCRLQVVDRNGEVRLMQSVLYHHDHHRLGILAVQ